MSHFDQLIERALGHARVVEPVVVPSLLGPPALGPEPRDAWAAQLDEVPAPPLASTLPRAPTAAASPSATSPASPPPRAALPARELVRTHEQVREVHVPDPAPSARPLPPIAPLGSPTHARPTSPSPIVERHVEVRSEHTRERIATSTHVERHTSSHSERLETHVTTRVEPARPASPGFAPGSPQPREAVHVPVQASPPRAAPIQPLVAAAPPQRPTPRPSQPTPRDAPLARRVTTPEPAPTLRIEIGRVIVRGDANATTQRSTPAPTRAMTSLSEYLQRRERGES